MAFVTFDDGQEQIEAVVFPKAYMAFKNLLEENKGLFVEGKISLRDNVISVLVDMLSETLPKNVSAYDFIIDIPEGTSASTLMELDRLLKNHPNGHRGLIVLPNKKEIKLTYGVHYNSDLEAKIQKLLKHS